MGAGASAGSSPCTVLSAVNFPEQLFVEGAGSATINGKFIMRTGNFHHATITGCNRSVWFSKEDDAGCWMLFLDAPKKAGDGDPDQRLSLIHI